MLKWQEEALNDDDDDDDEPPLGKGGGQAGQPSLLYISEVTFTTFKWKKKNVFFFFVVSKSDIFTAFCAKVITLKFVVLVANSNPTLPYSHCHASLLFSDTDLTRIWPNTLIWVDLTGF